MAYGYSWEVGQSKQVVYQTADEHIHELYIVKGGNWQHADLTAITGAPPYGYINNAYSWEAGQSKQVVYTEGIGNNAKIHELSVKLGKNWRHANLSAITGTDLPSEGAHGYSWKAGQSKQVVYVGAAASQIIELSKVKGERTWRHSNLTAITGPPFPGFNCHGYSWGAGQSKQIVYWSPDGNHIHELSKVKGVRTWQYADLTDLAGAPPAKGTIYIVNGYSWEGGQSKQVVYWTNDDHIQELRLVKGKTWQHADLTDITGTPPAKDIANGYSWEAGQSRQVVYSTDDGHIHELYIVKGGNWQHADLTAITGAPPADF